MEQPGTSNVWKPEQAKGWITDEAGYRKLLADNRIWWPPNPKTGKPRKKRFLSEAAERMPASTFWPEFRGTSGAADLDDILTERSFAFPKPVALVQRVIDYCAPPTCIVLDSFAGTGTTGHAVLQMNKSDGGNRRFICIEMDDTIARDVTAQRLKKVVEGYTNAKGEAVEPLGGGFRFCTLGKPLFDEFGNIDPDVKFNDLAAHVFFSETGSPLPKKNNGQSPLLGVFEERAVYLLFNGILGDKKTSGGNVLTTTVLDSLPQHVGPKVIYGEACRLGESRLRAANITFKQVPWEVRAG
jgi:site-specific DNA-methyltransferase (adenine-specific)/adenine-specific DNA-methyltransferase